MKAQQLLPPPSPIHQARPCRDTKLLAQPYSWGCQGTGQVDVDVVVGIDQIVISLITPKVLERPEDVTCPEEDDRGITAHCVIWKLKRIPPLSPTRGSWAET